MADILKFLNDDRQDQAEDEIERLKFIHDEGLVLLACYRKIEDPELRASILRLVRLLGVSTGETAAR